MRPFFTYYGAKWAAAKRYPQPIGVVVEPFAGAAGYSVRWDVDKAILFDTDPSIVRTWNLLIESTQDDILSIPLMDEGQIVSDIDCSEDERLIIGWWCNKATTRPSKSRSAWARDPRNASQFWGESIRRRLSQQVHLISKWESVCADFSQAPNESGMTVFVDPPYQIAGKHYRQKFDEYERLADWCLSSMGKTIVCEGPGADWLPFTEMYRGKATTKARGSASSSREFVWTRGL